jgi:hypothetical protein
MIDDFVPISGRFWEVWIVVRCCRKSTEGLFRFFEVPLEKRSNLGLRALDHARDRPLERGYF